MKDLMSFQKIDILNYGSSGKHTVYYRKDLPIKLSFLDEPSEQTVSHSSLKIVYVLKGKVELSLENRRHHLFSEDTMLINMHTFHQLKVLADTQVLIFHLDEEYVIQKFSEPIYFESIWSRKSQVELQMLLLNIALHFFSVYSADIAINTFLEKLSFLLDAQKTRDISHQQKVDPIAFVVERLSYNLNLNLQDLSEESFLSYSHLSREFNHRTGENFALYSRKIKLNRSVWLLIESNSTIAHISQEVGFSNNQVFGRNFKRFFGMTPTEFRNHRFQVETDLNNDEKLLLRTLSNHKEKLLEKEAEIEEHAVHPYDLKKLDYTKKQSNWGDVVLLSDLTTNCLNISKLKERILQLNIKAVHVSYEYCIDKKSFLPNPIYRRNLADLDTELPLILEVLNDLGLKIILGFGFPRGIAQVEDLNIYPNALSQAFNRKIDGLARRFGLSSLRSWSYEVELDYNTRSMMGKSPYFMTLINNFRLILVERLETPHIHWGIYLGACNYHDIQNNFFCFEKKLDCKPHFFRIDYEIEVKHYTVNFNYLEALLNKLKEYAYEYHVRVDFVMDKHFSEVSPVTNMYFCMGLISKLLKTEVSIFLLTYRIVLSEGKKDFQLFSKQGIESIGYHFIQFLKHLFQDFYYDEKSGIVISKSDEDYNLLIFSKEDKQLNNHLFDLKQSEVETKKYLLKDIQGRYKLSKQRIDFEKHAYYESWLRNIETEDLTIQEYNYIRRKLSPELKIKCTEINDSYLIDLDMYPIDFVIYQLKKI